jgi:hypothetical protein
MKTSAPDPFEIDEAPMEVIPLRLSEHGQAPAPVPRGSLDAAAVAVEVWRIRSRLKRAAPLLPAKEAKPLESALARLEELVAAAGITIEDPEGRPYVEGERMEVILFEPQDALERPCVVQTVKPAIFLGGALLRAPEVIVGVPKGDPRSEEAKR